jgi:hypothetical protein
MEPPSDIRVSAVDEWVMAEPLPERQLVEELCATVNTHDGMAAIQAGLALWFV